MPPRKAKKIVEKRVGVDGLERYQVEWEGNRPNSWHLLSTLPNRALLKEFEQELFEVEAIIDSKMENGQKLWLVKWKGYPATENSWEPESSLKSCRKLLTAFEQQQANTTSTSAQNATVQPIRRQLPMLVRRGHLCG